MKVRCPLCRCEFPFKEISQQLGRASKGVKRKFSPEQIAIRTARIKAVQSLGGRKRKGTIAVIKPELALPEQSDVPLRESGNGLEIVLIQQEGQGSQTVS